ncbi:MAG TPA: cytochrome c biogenesis protein CcdA, partial [Candidatus Eisenbacteria bacterium]|nr:cytochrome c biogenesis protein CcdA [Candidatus Eisenbacteria bacterium]
GTPPAPAAPPAGTPSAGVTAAGAAPASAIPADRYSSTIAHGGWLAFFWLFVWGLALNLTPCVYPMLGVTVSIFGAKRTLPTPLVMMNAAVYVLGMASMYTALGVIAALTGAMFGGFLQSPPVLIGLGVLLAAMSLSMFGLYELNPPPQLLTMLGGSKGSSVVGMFLSGLVVGVFAAPCIGPVVVSLLAIVAARGDVGFGLRTFLTLALGLGAPYLVLGTFSNLLQRMPRSGEWMVWVKKVFGVVTLAVGAHYAALGVAPSLARWVMPAALVLGGLYLGFLENSGKGVAFRRFKWALGAAGAIAGVWLVVTAPGPGIEFRPFEEQAYQAALASGRPVMLDFSADWCGPCHELENATFTDARVIARAKGFTAFKLDLTRSDSPEAEQWRRRFNVRGVPAVLFVAPDGAEVRGARVERFMGPDEFLPRIELAARGGQAATRE